MIRPPRIEIVAYDRTWPTLFASERKALEKLLGSLALRVDHVGSTAVPGLAAKPVIDIQISVRSLEPRSAYDELLSIRGYVHVPVGEWDRVYPFYQRPAMWPTTHHVHLCIIGSEQERAHLAFRDFLRDHDQEARAYEALKHQLSESTVGTSLTERESYSLAKTDFVSAVVSRALAEGYPKNGTNLKS